MILEHEAGAPSLGGHMHALARVLEDLAVEHDAPLHLVEAGQRPQERGLARTVGTEHRNGLARCGREGDIEREAIAPDPDRGIQCHSAPSQRSRMPARIATDTTSRMRLSVMAASGLVSSAR